MKKFFILFIAVFALYSCSKEDSSNMSPLANFKIDDINVSSEGLIKILNLPIGVDYSVTTSDNTWNFIYTYKNTQSLHIIINENTSNNNRSSIITITDLTNNYKVNFTINQSPGDFFIIENNNGTFDYKNNEFTLNINTNVQYDININCDFIKLKNKDNNKLTFNLDENISSARAGEIEFTYNQNGIRKNRIIVINQYANPNIIKNDTIKNDTIKNDTTNNKLSEEVKFGCSTSMISIGNNVNIVLSASCNNDTDHNIEIIEFNFYVDDKLTESANNLPIIIESTKSITYNIKYNGLISNNAYIIWKYKNNNEVLTKRIDVKK